MHTQRKGSGNGVHIGSKDVLLCSVARREKEEFLLHGLPPLPHPQA